MQKTAELGCSTSTLSWLHYVQCLPMNTEPCRCRLAHISAQSFLNCLSKWKQMLHFVSPVRFLDEFAWGFSTHLPSHCDTWTSGLNHHMPISCLVLLLLTFNRQLLEVGLSICHILSHIYCETSQCDTTLEYTKKYDIFQTSLFVSSC